MMGCEGEGVHQSGSGWSPVFVEDNLCVMSAGFLLPSPGLAVLSFHYSTLFLDALASLKTMLDIKLLMLSSLQD